MRILLALAVFAAGVGALFGADKSTSLQSSGGALRVDIQQKGRGVDELVRIKDGGKWVSALSVSGSATRVIAGTPGELQTCRVQSLAKLHSPDRVVIFSDCGAGRVEQTLAVASESDVINVDVRFTPKPDVPIHSVEDRYIFAPARRDSNSLTQGPLDFVWSQNLKNEPDGLIPHWSFKSPVVMLQQDRVFAALMPNLSDRSKVPLALDLNVTSEAKPWLSFGSVPSEPYGHSYFRRDLKGTVGSESEAIEYSYAIVASSELPRLGYRRVVRRLWNTLGHPQLLQSVDLQGNVRRPELALFDDWRQDAWVRYANQVYHDVDCPGGGCGTLSSMRNYMGDWDHPVEDAWFNSWFQSLRTAYGWRHYGRQTNNKEMERKAEAVLTLALKSPQQDGAFPTIYLVPDQRWIREDGWAGFPEDYHAFCMSWTGYWMLQWAKDLVPERKGEVLAFTQKYGDFLVKQQLPSGVIPSWYDSDLKPRPEFRDFNAETAGSALFLLELGEATGNRAYLDAGERALQFISREVLPRQRWFDFETFKSCARKDFSFYDPITAQYPQNNLSTIQAAMAYLRLYQISKDQKWLDSDTHVLDYLLLTQQVWSDPAFTPGLLGGFTTQNTDAEWSDARQAYAAVLLWNYYQATGQVEYLERAVAAARSTFAVAPWENWAHTGYTDHPGAMTGFHWGTGSAMTSVEIMSPTLGDAFINLRLKHGVGFNACSLSDVKVDGTSISFSVDASPRLQNIRVRFMGVDPSREYRIAWNGRTAEVVDGRTLASEGYVIKR